MTDHHQWHSKALQFYALAETSQDHILRQLLIQVADDTLAMAQELEAAARSPTTPTASPRPVKAQGNKVAAKAA